MAVVAGGLAVWRARERLGDWIADRLARRPTGLIGRGFYRDAKPHQVSFRETLDVLALSPEDRFLYRPDAVLAEIRRTLAPGGRVAIHTDATGFMAPPPIARRMRLHRRRAPRPAQTADYADITVRRTGPGERVQLATARKPDPATRPA
jgi:hypothetical protein